MIAAEAEAAELRRFVEAIASQEIAVNDGVAIAAAQVLNQAAADRLLAAAAEKRFPRGRALERSCPCCGADTGEVCEAP